MFTNGTTEKRWQSVSLLIGTCVFKDGGRKRKKTSLGRPSRVRNNILCDVWAATKTSRLAEVAH